MDEQRLPFPIHGTRLSGDGYPARGVGEAARLLYFVNLIAQTAGVPVFQLSRQTPYGVITASVHGPLAFKSVRAVAEPEEMEEEPVQGVHRLVWLPEGFVITPRTAGAPDGFGMPPTSDGRGTPGGPLRQVIINKFKDNQYPDAVYRWAVATAAAKPGATDEEIAAAASKVPAGTVFAANLFFMGWEMDDPEFGIGIMEGEGDDAKRIPQFSQRWVPNYREPESDDWHCHRPQHHLQESDLEALIRQETNLIREGAGQPPLGKPLRGTTGELSQNIAYQIRMSGVMDHDSTKFRAGHRTLGERTLERSAFGRNSGENLYLGAPADVDAAFVRKAMDGWTASPGHYENMIANWSEDGERYAWVDPAISVSGEAADGGALGVQIFHGADAALDASPGVHGDRPPIGASGRQDMFVRIFPHREPTEETSWPVVTYRGRTFYITDDEVNADYMTVLSGATMGQDGAVAKMRLCVLLRPQLAQGAAFAVIYEGDAHDFLATKTELARYQLPYEDAGDISTPVWSRSGARAALCFTTLAPVPAGRIRFGVAQPNPTSFVGQQVHFVEFDGASWVSKGADSLEIDPTDFSTTHYKSSCNGSARILPVYSGEALQYVSVEVDSLVYFSAARFEKRVHGSLVFPGGTRIVYADLSSHDEYGVSNEPVRGFERHILPFDVSDPASVAYVQYDYPETVDAPGISARLMIRGQQVMYSLLAHDSGAPGPQYRTQWAFGSGADPQYMLDSVRGNPYWTYANGGGGFSFFEVIKDRYVPSIVFNGLVVSDSNICPPSRLAIGPFESYRGPVASRPYDTDYVLVGPTLLRDGRRRYERLFQDSPSTEKVFDRVEEFRYAKYKGEWIYAGRIENTFGGTGEYVVNQGAPSSHTIQRSAWMGDSQYYFHSSLDIKAITGLPDLKNNILPIGVL